MRVWLCKYGHVIFGGTKCDHGHDFYRETTKGTE